MKFLVIILLFISCSKNGDKRLEEQASIQSKQSVEAENNNQRQWVEKIESDLRKRKNYFNAIIGEYKGYFGVDGSEFSFFLTIDSSLPIVFPTRERTLSEVNFELEKLTLIFKLTLENPKIPNSAITCKIFNYQPNVDTGIFSLISENCSNTFNLALSTIEKDQDRSKLARALAKDIHDRKISEVESFDILFESSSSSKKYRFSVTRY